MINKLQPLSYDMSEYDLSILAPCNDRLATKLILDDYDWMSYSLETYFPTKSQGFLSVKVEYFGLIDCQMEVKQTFNISKENEYNIYHNYIFSTDIFEDFITAKKDIQIIAISGKNQKMKDGFEFCRKWKGRNKCHKLNGNQCK